MISSLCLVLASNFIPVPDTGTTGFLLGAAVIGTGLIARFVKNRKS